MIGQQQHHQVLALDLGSVAGWARYDGESTTSGTVNTKPKRDQANVERFITWEHWLRNQLCAGASYVAYEEVTFGHKSLYAAQIYHGMAVITMMVCRSAGIICEGYQVGTIKKVATGKGNAGKERMLQTAQAQWPSLNVTDHNQADALWIMYCANEHLGNKQAKHVERLAL